MTTRHTFFRRAPATLLTLLAAFPLGSSARAHDFWLQPTDWALAPGKTACFELRVGDSFEGELVPRDESYVSRFVARVPDEAELVAVEPLPGLANPAGWIRPGRAGTHAIGYESQPRYLELHAIKFREYLLEEGLTETVNERMEHGEERDPGREEFVRCAKTLLGIVDPDPESSRATFVDAPLGLTLEFVALDDPEVSAAKDMKKWRVQLLRDGTPVVGARARCISERIPGERSPKPQVALTDEKGIAVFELTPGKTWLISSVQMARAEEDRESTDAAALGLAVDWVSHWASLTFQS